MKISKKFILAHRTPKGFWTKRQLTAIGVPWPAPSDWIDSVVGRHLSKENAAIFESSNIPSKKKKELALEPKDVLTDEHTNDPSVAVSIQWGFMVSDLAARTSSTRLSPATGVKRAKRARLQA